MHFLGRVTLVPTEWNFMRIREHPLYIPIWNFHFLLFYRNFSLPISLCTLTTWAWCYFLLINWQDILSTRMNTRTLGRHILETEWSGNWSVSPLDLIWRSVSNSECWPFDVCKTQIALFKTYHHFYLKHFCFWNYVENSEAHEI